jgi:hypothetical protein
MSRFLTAPHKRSGTFWDIEPPAEMPPLNRPFAVTKQKAEKRKLLVENGSSTAAKSARTVAEKAGEEGGAVGLGSIVADGPTARKSAPIPPPTLASAAGPVTARKSSPPPPEPTSREVAKATVWRKAKY